MVPMETIGIIAMAMFGWASSNQLNTTLREKIPFYLQNLCPGSGVCLNDIIDPENDNPSCCGVCSCSAECVKEGNCCFQSQNKKTLDSTIRFYSECMYPIANNYGEAFHYDVFVAYYMISSTSEEAIIKGRTNKTVSCGEVSVAPWGSLYPVYSKNTGKIYKNMLCANAYNVTDGELWRVYISCKIYDIGFVSRLRSGSIPDRCIVRFVYNGAMSLLKSESCYQAKHYKGSCKNNSFTLPVSSSISREDIVAACESGLISPYKNIYANVFCFLCGSSVAPRQVQQGYCADKNVIEDSLVFRGSDGSVPFTILFGDNAFIETNKDIVQTDHHEISRTACPKENLVQNGKGCRTISCPTGQIFSRVEDCIYPGNKWHMNQIRIIITLSSEGIVNISSLYRSIQNLKSPWPNSWMFDMISYKVTDVPMQTKLIMVIQYLQFHSPINPTSFFSMVKNYTSKPWLLMSGKETIKLQAEISKFIFGKLNWKLLFVRPNWRATKTTLITKLFFCDQVIMLPSEYLIKGSTHKDIFNKITNKTLHDGEYTIVDSDHGPVLTICLEDSGFYRMSSNKSIKICPHAMIIHCLAIVFLNAYKVNMYGLKTVLF